MSRTLAVDRVFLEAWFQGGIEAHSASPNDMVIHLPVL